MTRLLITTLSAILSACSTGPDLQAQTGESPFDARRADWRAGAVTYQIFVDRFAPSNDIDSKRHLYAPPRTLEAWSEQPAQGEPVPGEIVWSHELAFWGGDLDSVRRQAGYLDALGVDVVYLNPIHLAPTNHKYDAIDLTEISPEYGTRADLRALADTLHANRMRLVLDGVFNHVGVRSHWFVDAQSSPDSPYRDWFHFGEDYQNGYVGWWGVANLPQLNWNNTDVSARIATAPDSVVRQWFRDGIDGWRLDVATELGFDHLATISAAVHETRPGALVIGEVWSYPQGWTGSLDAVMNFPLREMMFAHVEGRVGGAELGEAVETMIADAGLDPLLRSWILLDNHDTPRLRTLYPDPADRAYLQALQFALPGAPLIYYGVEAGMTGGHDPGSRGPMDWENARPDNPEFARLRALIEIRESAPALRIGDFVPLATRDLLAFLRTTDRSAETVLVVANNRESAVTETLLIRDGRLMNGDVFEDAMSGETFNTQSSTIEVTVPARSVRILAPRRWPDHTGRTGHSPYRHVP
ncbi:glycoside hydrolase family 13 protein [Maricaulis sp.]|jgi:glycosidase|uniref:glycoside hydrolase family 13 protein n=1 Tax=Maricaulis sp. TaxID=1486257 RepID=UPI002622F381|nr:glycoside hydrolase family 13 protein [Maricaulis sp.]